MPIYIYTLKVAIIAWDTIDAINTIEYTILDNYLVV